MEPVLSARFGPDQFAAVLKPSFDFRSQGSHAEAAALHIFDAEPRDLSLPPTTHHTLAVMLNGVTHLERESDSRRGPEFMRPGDCTISPIGGGRRWSWDGSVRVAQLYVPQGLFDDCAEQRGAHPDRVAPIDTLVTRDAFLRQAIVSTIRELRDGLPLAGLYVESVAHLVAAHLLNHYTRKRPGDHVVPGGCGRLDAVIEWIETDLAADMSLEALARYAGMSRATFLRAFRARTGRSPHQYILERRVAVARSLLEGTRMPVSEVANALGFADQAHFTRRFRQSVGVTPARYRQG